MNLQTLLDCYTGTVFRTPDLDALPDEYAIITVWNPLGTPLTEQQNHARDLEFVVQLEQYALPHSPMHGYAPEGDYHEEGWAIQTSWTLAKRMAQQWQQNAFYWVTQGKLFLVPAQLDFAEQLLSNQVRQRITLL